MEYVINVDGIDYEYDVLMNLAEPCPQCGVPACGKENYFWYEQGGRRKTLILDGDELDMFIHEFFESKIQEVDYASLPKFLRESIECSGWADAMDHDGAELDIDDLLLALDTIELTDLVDWMRDDASRYLQELRKIALTAKEKNTKLLVVRN